MSLNLIQLPALIVILILTAPILSLLYLYRFLVLCYLRLTSGSDDILPLTGLDAAFASDPFHTVPRGGTAFIWICEGALSPSSLLQRFSFLKDNPDYLRLTSLIPRSRMGLGIWVRCRKTYRVQNHFKILTPGNDLNSSLVEWMRSPFKEDQPLWEVGLIPSLTLDGQPRSLLGLKIHHTIGDGVSKLRLLERILDSPALSLEPGPYPNDNPSFAQLLFKHGLRIPATLWTFGTDFLLHKDPFTSRKSSDDVLLLRATFPMHEFKTVRALFGQKYQSTLTPPPLLLLGMALLTGALGRLANFVSNLDQLSDINFLTALPIPGRSHPLQFCNFWTHSLLRVQIGEKSPSKRLSQLLEHYNTRVKDGHWAEVYSDVILPVQGLLPSPVWSWMVNNLRMGAPFGVTNMIGPSEPMTICGSRILEKYAYVGLLWRHSGMTAAFFSYSGHLSLTLVANRGLFTCHPEFDHLLTTHFVQELNLLQAELS